MEKIYEAYTMVHFSLSCVLYGVASRGYCFSACVGSVLLRAFNALRLTGVLCGLAHLGCSQHQSLTKHSTEQAVTFCSDYAFTLSPFHLCELLKIAFRDTLGCLER